MKALTFAVVLLLGSFAMAQETSVRSYQLAAHSQRVHSAPQYRTAPDGFLYYNYSSYPHINPYPDSMGLRITPTPPYRPRPSYFTPGYQAPQRGGNIIRFGRS